MVKESELELRKEQIRLKEEERLAAIERNKRMTEYRIKKTQDKILEGKKKTELLLAKKQQLREKRKEFRIKANLAKDKLMKTFEKMKVSRCTAE